MSLFATVAEFSAALLDASLGLVLIVKWTVVLALAWLAHAMLAGRNPRWRVALWRSTVVGLALAAVLSVVPAFMTFHLSQRNQPLSAVAPVIPTLPAVEIRGATEVVPVRDRIEATGAAPSFDPSAVAVGRGDPAPTMPEGFRWGERIVPWLCAIWLAGVLVLTARLILGILGLARVIRRSSDVPDGVIRECRTIAGHLACRGSVRVRRTSDAATPCLAGLWRRVVLLPERECDNVRPDDLRAILAHELAHARNHDLAWNLTAHLASILLWFHPLAWRIRPAHAAACDAVCDAVAADLLGDVASYSRTLARLAVRAARPSPVHGLAMARTSDVRRRLDALNLRLFRTPLSWRQVMPAIVLGTALLVLIGGFGFTRAEPAATTPRADAVDEKTGVVQKDYQTASGPATPNLNSVFILKQGYTVRGRVVDASGRRVRGAMAVIGRSYSDGKMPAATTNSSGEFAIEKCAEGPNIVTVQAEGFAPELRVVRVGEPLEPLEPLAFRLQPGSELRLRVVDTQGKPVGGAFVFAQTWRRYHSIELRTETDSEGRLTWRSAPPDAVLYDIGKTGFMPCRALPLIASEQEQVVTLRPKLVITGRATDAETGKPLPKCLIIEGVGFVGSDQISWSRASATEVSGGEYTASFNEPNYAMYVRVEALGYEPALSRAFRPEEGAQRFDFALERADTLSGTVQLLNGKPAEGVDVVVATETDQVLFQGGHFESRTSAPRSKTGPDGRFAFTTPKGNFVLIALGDAGYADASPADFAKSHKIVIQPWGRLEGEVMAGRRPKANEEISFSPGRPRGGLPHGVFIYQYDIRTDDHGRFAFDRVIPGPGLVTRAIVTNFGRFSQRLVCGGDAVDILPGRTTKVHIGGQGRPVIGQVVLEERPDTPIEWTHNPPAMMTRLNDQKNNTASAYIGLGSNFDKDGRFRIDDVTPGIYTLGFSINAEPNPQAFERGEVIGLVQVSVTVPEVPAGESDQPLDLGTITAKLFERLKVGDLAPEFAVPRLAGKGNGDQLRLADYRGKLVLVDFWATWCGPCLAEMSALKDIQKTFGADPHFALISLACDQKDEAAKQYIRENGLIWTHGFVGDLATGAGLSYKVRSIPATFLIGPDGRVLAKDLRGSELKDAIRMALLADERSRK